MVKVGRTKRLLKAVDAGCCQRVTNLRSVTIPPTISFIAGDAFAKCSA